MANLALARPSPLGGYAAAIETSPVATLTATGAITGAFWGGLLGWMGAHVADRDATTWALAGVGAGALVMGFQGHAQGVELSQWLKQH